MCSWLSPPKPISLQTELTMGSEVLTAGPTHWPCPRTPLTHIPCFCFVAFLQAQIKKNHCFCENADVNQRVCLVCVVNGLGLRLSHSGHYFVSCNFLFDNVFACYFQFVIITPTCIAETGSDPETTESPDLRSDPGEHSVFQWNLKQKFLLIVFDHVGVLLHFSSSLSKNFVKTRVYGNCKITKKCLPHLGNMMMCDY